MQLCEPCPHRLRGYQSQRRVDDRTRQEWFSRAKGDRTYLHEDFVKQAAIVKLACELAATDDPDVLPTGRRRHFLVDWPHIAADEADVHPRNRWPRTRAEHPGRLRVWPRLPF